MTDKKDDLTDLLDSEQKKDMETRNLRKGKNRDPLAEEALRDRGPLGPPVRLPVYDYPILKQIPPGSRGWGNVRRYVLDQITSGTWKDPISDAYDFFFWVCGLTPKKAHFLAEEIYDKATRILRDESRDSNVQKAMVRDPSTDE